MTTVLADEYLVRISEKTSGPVVLEMDFLVYRRNRMLTIPLLAPFL